MVFVSHWCTEYGHDTITGELIDCAFVFVGLIHHDLKNAIHNLKDLFRIEFFRQGRVISYVSKKNCYYFSFTLKGTAGCEDFISEVFWGV